MSKRMEVTVEDNGIATLKMNDVVGKNEFSNDFVAELLEGLEEIGAKHTPKVMILQGLPEVFSAGADKGSLMSLCAGDFVVKDLVVSEKLLALEYPVIAAMEGHAMGGGLVMALCCDIVIAARESRYGAVFMNMGFTPGMGCTLLLDELFGTYIASEMMYTGKRFRGSELEAMGTHVNHILPRAEVMKRARDIALQIADKNIKSLYLLKNTLSARKKKLLIDARVQEDLMHRLSFSFPETRKTIEEMYGG